MLDRDVFAHYLDLWSLTPEGTPIATHSSRLLPVSHLGQRAMLKVALAEEERIGGALLANWQSGPFAQVLAQSGDAVLMVRAGDRPSLVEMAKGDGDREATLVLCELASRIHDSEAPRSDLVSLETRFADLFTATGDAFDFAKITARELLDSPQELRPLHGDLHHGNVLHFGASGWLAIDPKGVLGERGFDYANIFCNPSVEVALRPGRFEDQIEVAAQASGLERARLCRWVVAWTGLSAVWSIQSGDDPEPALEIGKIAALSLRG